jgi:hypothetical protein
MCNLALAIPYRVKMKSLLMLGDDAQSGVEWDVMRVTFVEVE